MLVNQLLHDLVRAAIATLIDHRHIKVLVVILQSAHHGSTDKVGTVTRAYDH